MWANNEIGVLFPVEKKAVTAPQGHPVSHRAVQWGKFLLNLRQSAIDLLSLSGHKLHAPKGVGALYVRKGTRLSPFLIGGHHLLENTCLVTGLAGRMNEAPDP